MIQRIQSVYLTIAAVLLGLSLVMNWSTYVVEGAGFVLNGMECSVDGVGAIPLTLAIAVALVLILATLFGYKNRKIQKNLAVVSMVQLLLTMAMFGVVHVNAMESLKANFSEEINIGYGIALALPIIALVLLWLARKAIKKDDDLVKSVDRLR